MPPKERPSSAGRGADSEEERFRLLVESVKDYAIFILDTGGHVATWNLGAERIKGYKADEIIGKHFSIFYPPEDVAAGKTERELEIASREGRFEEEGWRVRKDGSRIWASVTITALRNPEGELIGFAKVTRDLTERRQAEESRRALAAEKAALAEKAKIQQFQERFLAILGHDLRNPLASIDIGAGVLRQRATDPVDLRVVNRMRDSSQRMSRMIEQILDLTRTRLAGGLELNPDAFDLRDTIARVVEELRVAHPSRSINVGLPPAAGDVGQGSPGAGVLEPRQQRARAWRSSQAGGRPGACRGPVVVRSTSTTTVRPFRKTLQAAIFDPFDGAARQPTLEGAGSAWVSTSRRNDPRARR